MHNTDALVSFHLTPDPDHPESKSAAIRAQAQRCADAANQFLSAERQLRRGQDGAADVTLHRAFSMVFTQATQAYDPTDVELIVVRPDDGDTG